MCLSIVNEQLFFFIQENESKMSCRIITCLVKKCCPIPKGCSAPCGNDGNRGTCQEMVIRDWTFMYSHYQPFQKEDDRHDWPHALYHKTCKCNSSFAGWDCSKCKFGFGLCYTELSVAVSSDFMVLSK